MSAEVVALRVAKSVASRAALMWLDGRRQEQQRELDLGELVRLRIPGLRAQRSVRREFERITDSVAARLEPICGHDFPDLTMEDRQAAVEAVVGAFTQADLSDEAILAADCDPVEWARRVQERAPAPDGLGPAAAGFYQHMMAECCDCYLRILRHLPVFTERAVTELLGRLSDLGAEIERVLDRLPARALYAPQGEDHDDAFRREYLGLISSDLDEVELFSVLSGRAPRARLSVAYLSLRVSSEGEAAAGWERSQPWQLRRRDEVGAWGAEGRASAGLRVEAALKRSHRALVRGEAGSGKTTLLHWLAVTAARRGFTGELADWNGLIPLLVRLRSYAGRQLPRPGELLDATAAPLVGHMPTAWADRVLAAGQALLLVDGIDELVASERHAVRAWLRQLLLAYPHTRVVVTSRPTAAGSDWLRTEEFTAVSLERMTPADLEAFITQWHRAVRVCGGPLPCPPEQLADYERALAAALQDRPHLAALAASPLLAAMLCALHLDRHRQLPRSRMELYQTALELLVQRRDAERGIPSAQQVNLDLSDKLCVLQDLAWRLSDNNRSELARDKAIDYVTAKTASMPHLDADGPTVFDHLLHRSGVLRTPAAGRIDFVHRTFQEYLAAVEATAEDRIGNLIGRAHLDPWRETIIMAAGSATRGQRVELITGILDRAETEARHRRTLRLLATACLETMTSIPDPIAERLNAAIDALLPPHRYTEAPSLALVGDPLLRRLPTDLAGLSEKAAAATVDTAALIGGEKALALLTGYTTDPRWRVHRAIANAWPYFDPDDYAHRVLAKLPLETTAIQLTHPSQLNGLALLKTARDVNITFPMATSLDTLPLPPELEYLAVLSLASQDDVSVVRRFTQLRVLQLYGGETLDDTSFLRDLPQLSALFFQGWKQLPGIEDMSIPPSVRALGLGRLAPGADISVLEKHAEIRSLFLEGSGRIRNLASLHAINSLNQLALTGVDLRADLAIMAAAIPHARRLDLMRCQLPEDLAPLAGLPNLTTLWLFGGSTGGESLDLRPFSDRPGPRRLSIVCIGYTTVHGLDSLPSRVRVRRR